MNDLVISINPQSGKKSMVGELNMDVFYGVQTASEKETKPIIAISAGYDSFGAAPSLPSGIEASLSPLLAVMHMSRTFGKQFVQIVKSRFDLMFILTPSSSLGYTATSKFLDYIQGTLKSKIQLVVCLDQLVDSTVPYEEP